ncbi:MAG: hypothetical protein ATN33_05370 [Epulopiscium sp. Nele67-Bin001]|nr:MAG: hypothetical protein ATN33_05370 [Epulopiscium sp. Nele67-Bin001]
MAKKKVTLSLDEKLKLALVPEHEQPYAVPDNWVWVKSVAVLDIIMGQSPKGVDTSNNNIDGIGLIGGASDMGVLFPRISRYTKAPTKLSQSSDVILSIRATLGQPIYSDGIYCLGRGVAAIRSSYLSKELIRYYYLNFEPKLYEKATGTTFLQVNSEVLKQLPFPLPPLDEQTRIVNRIESLFAKLDKVKTIIQQAMDSFDNRKTAILHMAFTGELTKNWRNEHKISLDTWEEKLLKDVCTINPKKVSTNELSDETEVTFVPMASVSELKGEITSPLTEALLKVKKGYTNFQEGDIIFAKITPCMENGKAAIVSNLQNNLGFGSTEFHVIRCIDGSYNRFMYHLIRWQKFRDEAKAVMTGAVGQQRVPKAFLENYSLPLPTLVELFERNK